MKSLKDAAMVEQLKALRQKLNQLIAQDDPADAAQGQAQAEDAMEGVELPGEKPDMEDMGEPPSDAPDSPDALPDSDVQAMFRDSLKTKPKARRPGTGMMFGAQAPTAPAKGKVPPPKKGPKRGGF